MYNKLAQYCCRFIDNHTTHKIKPQFKLQFGILMSPQKQIESSEKRSDLLTNYQSITRMKSQDKVSMTEINVKENRCSRAIIFGGWFGYKCIIKGFRIAGIIENHIR